MMNRITRVAGFVMALVLWGGSWSSPSSADPLTDTTTSPTIEKVVHGPDGTMITRENTVANLTEDTTTGPNGTVVNLVASWVDKLTSQPESAAADYGPTTTTDTPISATFTFTFFSTPVALGSAHTDGKGEARLSFAVPGNVEPGPHTITAVATAQDGRTITVSAPFTIPTTAVLGERITSGSATGSATEVARGSLAATGSSSANVAVELGAGLVALGGALLLAIRRRRKTSDPSA